MGKYRYPVILFIVSAVFLVIGLLFKIQHWPGGRLITGSMLMVQVIALIWLGVILYRDSKKA